MRATKIPTTPAIGRYEDVAIAYGMTVDALRNADMSWLQNEGYCQSCGHECETLHDWLIHNCVDRIAIAESQLEDACERGEIGGAMPADI